MRTLNKPTMADTDALLIAPDNSPRVRVRVGDLELKFQIPANTSPPRER